MFRPALLGAPILLIVLLVHGSDPTASPATTTTTTIALPKVSPVAAFTLPAPPATDPPTTTTVAPTTTTEPPTTAPPETAAPETAPPTEAPAPVATAPKPRRTTTTAHEAPPTDPPDTEAPTTAPRPDPVAVPGDASAVIGLTNQQRAAAGLGPLAANGALHAAAQRESNDMAAQTKMSHTGSDGSTVATRVTAAGYSWHAVGENIAVGYGSAAGVVTGWMNSAGHRANILNGVYTDIGVAVATGADGNKYWTMVLGA
jgi:uncharacterized protein YkwD